MMQMMTSKEKPEKYGKDEIISDLRKAISDIVDTYTQTNGEPDSNVRFDFSAYNEAVANLIIFTLRR